MSARLCPQSPLVDASDDGRLNATDRASIERHIAVCGSCATRFDQNEKIREALRTPHAEVTELEHLRARTALLRAASMGASTDVRRPSRVARIGLALAAAIIVTATCFGGRMGVGSYASARVASVPSAPAQVGTRDASVVPSDGARFERMRGGGMDTVTLSSGSLAVSTGTLAGERLIVRTKDAEVESKDGVFHVEADDGRIRDIVVERGTVEVRYAGFTAVIPSGGSWRGTDTAVLADASPRPASAPSVTAPPATSAAPVIAPPIAVAMRGSLGSVSSQPITASVKPAVLVVPEAVPAASASATEVAGVTPSASPAAPPPPAAGGVFSGAMRTLERGDFDGAAVALGAFSAAHPDDPRADDAEYVRAIALQRAGHTGEARAAAQNYLAHRPNGAHRAEAMHIAGD